MASLMDEPLTPEEYAIVNDYLSKAYELVDDWDTEVTDTLPIATGYEYGFISLDILEPKEKHTFLKADGECARCGATASPNWYQYSSIENYLPKNEVICETCCNNISNISNNL